MWFEWNTQQLTKLVPGSQVARVSDGVREFHVVLKEPILDADWVGCWRVFLELGDSCFTVSISELDPQSVVPAPRTDGNDLVRRAGTLKLERDILRGQVANVRRELIEMFIRDLEPFEDATLEALVEKYEGMLLPG